MKIVEMLSFNKKTRGLAEDLLPKGAGSNRGPPAVDSRAHSELVVTVFR